MIAALAVVFALGVFLIYDAATRDSATSGRASRVAVARDRLAAWLNAAGLPNVSGGQFVVACGGCGVLAGFVTAVLLASPTIAALALVAGTYAPVAYFRGRRRARRRMFVQCWPDAIELLAGACRAGETLPGALGVVAERGPAPLRPAFRAVVTDHHVSGDLAGALERMASMLADPTADRVAATLTVAHRVGGRELVRVLRTLAAFLRDDAAIRKEIEARQSWTVVAARVSVAAPWIVLLLIASRPDSLSAYNSLTGLIVLVTGAAATLVGYRIMLAAGRLPEEPRVLAGGTTP